ncbi:hypothetical protein [Micromonospora sp. DT233]|uniref:hypothetical protein n=1 Tax=Micromonospora sp. DT233 TaxID=3393432 RepID=UPI003CF90510
MPLSKHFGWQVGDNVSSSWRPGSKVRYTELMCETLPVVRGILIAAARRQQTITYGELAIAVDRRYHNLQFGDLLDVLSQDCEDFNEPSLAALVVNQRTGLPGGAFIGDAVAGKQDCFRYWEQQG